MFTTYDLRNFLEGLAILFAIGYWGTMLLLLWFLVRFAYKKPKRNAGKILSGSLTAAAILILFVWMIPKQFGPSKEEIQAQEEWDRKYKEAEAVFNEQCKTAGEKIYRTVDNVEGILLLKVPQSSSSKWGDSKWKDAALSGATSDLWFINSFLQYKAVPNDSNSPIKFTNEEKIYENYAYYKGYDFVDVKKVTGQIIRYNGIIKDNDLLHNIESNIHPKNPARYAVTYETEVYPNYWIAGARIIILDTQTNEILAEKKQYIFDKKLGSTYRGRSPWPSAISCGHINPMQREIRFFVDKVLQPKQETQNVK